jgi:hypothetical protein
MDINQKKIDDIKEKAKSILVYLNIPNELDELIDDNEFKKVYYNINGDDNRLKIMGNKHYTENGKKKQKSIQLYRLKREDRISMDLYELQHIYAAVMKLCYYIEQLKLHNKITELENKILRADEVASQDKELLKIFKNSKR